MSTLSSSNVMNENMCQKKPRIVNLKLTISHNLKQISIEPLRFAQTTFLSKSNIV